MSSLVLLIGTNPLPNYVVAEYLLSKQIDDPINEIWLVHSEKRGEQAGTKKTADRLKEVVSERYSGNISFNYCSLSAIGDAKAIEGDVKEKLLKYAEDGNVHLNYTGGTKAMSVHVYRTIEKSDKFKKKVFSYLDAREFCLKDDEEEIVSDDDLREEVFISLQDLAKLHGYEKKREGKSCYWLDTLEEFKKLIDQSQLSEFLEWKNGVIRKLYYEKGNFIESSNKIRERLNKEKNLFNNHLFKDTVLPLLQAFPKEHSILDETGEFLWIPDENTSKKYQDRVKPAVTEFLDGKWLENYVLMILKGKIAEEFSGKDIPIESNWELRKPGGKEFELDVIVMNGYQVCGISCTTDRKEDLCKLKGFEVWHRVNQIGGEEARAVLATCLTHNHIERGDQVEILEEDLRYETGSEGKKFIVLGIEDLKEEMLWKKIKKHIWRR